MCGFDGPEDVFGSFHPRAAFELEHGFECVDACDDVRPRVLLGSVFGFAKVLYAHLERGVLGDVRSFVGVGKGFDRRVELFLGVALAPHLDEGSGQDAAFADLHRECLGRDVDLPERRVVDASVRLPPLDLAAAAGHVGERLQLLAAEVQVPMEEVAQVPPHRGSAGAVHAVVYITSSGRRAPVSASMGATAAKTRVHSETRVLGEAE